VFQFDTDFRLLTRTYAKIVWAGPQCKKESFVFQITTQIYAYRKEKIQYGHNVIKTEAKDFKNYGK